MQAGADLSFMQRALALAAARLGRTWPNPSVGCVLVKDGEVLAEAATGIGGRPHAEEQALAAAGARARGAVAYVTLEPCSRRTAGGLSCTDLLLRAGIGRAVIALGDPHPKAGGIGLEKLKAAGVEVVFGVGGAEAEALNCGFIAVVKTGKPLVFADDDPTFYDAPFQAPPDGDYEAALIRMGHAGLTRLNVPSGSELAERLAAAGLLAFP